MLKIKTVFKRISEILLKNYFIFMKKQLNTPNTPNIEIIGNQMLDC